MSPHNNFLNRRRFLSRLGSGLTAAALGANALTLPGCSNRTNASSQTPRSTTAGKNLLFKKLTEPARVTLVKGNDRREIVYQSLKMLEDDIIPSIGNRKILIKPNMVTSWNPLCATHPDAVRAILDVLTPHYKKQIIVGEATAFGNTFDGFKNYGYLPLEKEYNVKLIDLNAQPFRYRYVFGRGNRPLRIRIISTFLDPDIYIISAARMKTHDRVVTTLSIKNVILGSPVSDHNGNDKFLMHTTGRAVNTVLHYNMFHLAQQIYPDLAVIDGFEAMQGEGPISGTSFDARIALASRDPLAADTLATKIMGFDPTRIMYLTVMNEAGMGQGDLDKINVLGTPLNECLYHFKPNHRMAEIYNL